MSGDIYYLLTMLPGLDALEAAPPVAPGEFLEQIAGADGDRLLLEVVFLGDDLLQRQAYLAGELQEVEPAVLTLSQARNEESLPEYLEAPLTEGGIESSPDILWETYYRYGASIARKKGSAFLEQWIAFEVGLRNALAIARAKALDIDPQMYLVAEDLGQMQGDFESIISEWAAASDPFAGLRVLDYARWEWLVSHDGWFTFEDDELAAYGAKLMLLKRWKRLSGDVSLPVE